MLTPDVNDANDKPFAGRAFSNLRARLDTDAEAVLQEAEELLQARRNPELLRIAAEACRRLGLADDAEGAELAAIQLALSNPELAQAAAAQERGESTAALATIQRVLSTYPDDLLALTLAAEAEIDLWYLEAAEAKLKMVLQRAPSFLRASMLLTMCMVKQVRSREACNVLEDVLARKPRNTTALSRLAQLRASVGDVDQAVILHERLVEIEPARPDRWVDLAHQYRAVGRRDEAIRAFRQAIARDPTNAAAWWSLANYFAAELDERDEQALNTAIERHKGSTIESPLLLALGLLEDRKKNFARSFELLVAGKNARWAMEPGDAQVITQTVSEIIEVVTPDFCRQHQSSGLPDPSPIFLVGMPRSGTTLVERILGRHSAIEAAGELPVLRRCVELASHQTGTPSDYAAVLRTLDEGQLRALAERYVSASHDYRQSEKPHFIDKANLNWLHAGLILVAFPNAKIIDVRRNAVDCCWANFKVLYPAGFPEANDLSSIGQFYAQYVRLVDAMKAVAPDRILTVRYKDVVDDIASTTRQMLAFLNLPFEKECLDFHLSIDAVATPSSEQVRQPINRKGIDSSKPYAQWLQPLREALGPLAEA